MRAAAIDHAAAPYGSRVDAVRIAAATAVFLVVVMAATVLPFTSSIPMPPWVTPLDQALRLAASLLWPATMVISMVRFPENPIWKLILAFQVVAQISRVYVLDDSLVYSTVLLLGNLGLAVYIHLVLAFPSGHLLTRLDRRLAAFAYGYLVACGVLKTLAGLEWSPMPGTHVQNLFAFFPDDPARQLVGGVEAVIGAVVCLAVPIALWRHWREATPAGRRPLLPVVLSAPLMFAGIAVANLALAFDAEVPQLLPDPWWILAIPVQFIIPAGLLLGVLRIRLNRGRVADLVVQLGRGTQPGGLRDVLARALGDPTLQLAFAAPSGRGFVDPAGHAIELTASGAARTVTRLERNGELLGVLVSDPAIDAEDPGLVEAVGTAARLALENERLSAQVKAQLVEVRASRARIVEAGDAERRRIERDLHDGAQQRLVALALRLQVAREGLNGDAAILDEATAELHAAIGEVRDLARGLHPTILTEAGLGAALEALAERASLPVSLEVPDRRYPAPVEATAYFVAAEALTNVARHAAATEATVHVADDGTWLELVIRDDGRGGADAARGSGLRGLGDRVAAAGGSMDVASPPGEGTTILTRLPLR